MPYENQLETPSTAAQSFPFGFVNPSSVSVHHNEEEASKKESEKEGEYGNDCISEKWQSGLMHRT